MNIIKRKNLYFAVSLIVIIPGLISLLLFGLKPSIDFIGGSRLEYQVSSIKYEVLSEQISNIFKSNNVEVNSVQNSGKDTYIVRTKPLGQKTHQKILDTLQKEFPNIKEISSQTVGPTIGRETTWNAFKAVLVASFLIVLYIAWAFRKVPKPASSWRFGICAVVALLHDALVLIGVFSLLGYLYGVEVDGLFVTALLTVIGFSVHDTIVVFDRIRENLIKYSQTPFEVVVNESIIQTLGRSLKTSLTVILVLLALLLFGGETTRWFVVALLVGVTSGTYSSIFNAAPLLVWWQEWTGRKTTK